MHHVIEMIVYAKTKKEARSRAEETFNEKLIPRFDYGTFFDEEDTTISGKARWGNMPPVELANSKDGKALIDDGFDMIKKDFKENLENLKKILNNYDTDEIFEGEILDKNKQILKELEEEDETLGFHNPYWFNYLCRKISEGDWLYDNDGNPIKNSRDLKETLNKKYCEDKDMKVWVLPVDVHT